MFYFILFLSFLFFFYIIKNIFWEINILNLFIIIIITFWIQYIIDINLLDITNSNNINYFKYSIIYYYLLVSVIEESIKLFIWIIIAYILKRIYKIKFIKALVLWLLISISAFIFNENLLYIKNITDTSQQFLIFILRNIFSLPIHFFILILLISFKEKINITNFIWIFLFAIIIHAINDIWYTIGYSWLACILWIFILWTWISIYIEILEKNTFKIIEKSKISLI